MIEPTLIRTSILDAMQAVPQLVVFDGAVPAKVPADAAGYIRPYVAVYVGAPTGLAETTLDARPDTGSVTRWAQTTLVAASPGHLDPLATTVVRALTGLRIGTPAVTTRGYKEPDCVALAEWICDVLDNPNDEQVIAGVRANVELQCRKFPVYAG